jgi:hypothetical protein
MRFNQKLRKKNNPEGRIQLQILKYLRAIGAYAGKTKTMGVRRGKIFCFDPYTFRGKCDLEAFKNGIMYGIEVKSETGRLSPEQNQYKEIFHKPPDRIYIEAHSLQDIIDIIH